MGLRAIGPRSVSSDVKRANNRRFFEEIDVGRGSHLCLGPLPRSSCVAGADGRRESRCFSRPKPISAATEWRVSRQPCDAESSAGNLAPNYRHAHGGRPSWRIERTKLLGQSNRGTVFMGTVRLWVTALGCGTSKVRSRQIERGPCRDPASGCDRGRRLFPDGAGIASGSFSS
jgi:hypothetical protein